MRIIQLVRKDSSDANVPLVISVGVPLVQGQEAVEKITFNRLAYNKGYQMEGPSYTIYLVGSTVRRVIPASEVTEIAVETAKENDIEVAPLPDDESIVEETPILNEDVSIEGNDAVEPGIE